MISLISTPDIMLSIESLYSKDEDIKWTKHMNFWTMRFHDSKLEEEVRIFMQEIFKLIMIKEYMLIKHFGYLFRLIILVLRTGRPTLQILRVHFFGNFLFCDCHRTYGDS